MKISNIGFESLFESEDSIKELEAEIELENLDNFKDISTPIEESISENETDSKFSFISDDLTFSQERDNRWTKLSEISLNAERNSSFNDDLAKKEFYNNYLVISDASNPIYEYVREHEYIEPILLNALISLFLVDHTLDELTDLINYPFEIFLEKLHIDKVYDLNNLIFEEMENENTISVKVEDNRYIKVIDELTTPTNNDIMLLQDQNDKIYSLISDITFVNQIELTQYPLQFLCIYFRLNLITSFAMDLDVVYKWYKNKEFNKLHTNIYEMRLIDNIVEKHENFGTDILYSKENKRFFNKIGNNVIDFVDIKETFGQISYIENLDLYNFSFEVIEESKKLSEGIKEKYNFEIANIISYVLIEYMVEYQNYIINNDNNPMDYLYLTKSELLELVVNYYAYGNTGRSFNLKTLKFDENITGTNIKVETVDTRDEKIVNYLPNDLRIVTNDRLLFLMYRFLLNNDDDLDRWRKALVKSYNRNILKKKNLSAFLKSIESDYFEYSKLPANTHIFELI